MTAGIATTEPRANHRSGPAAALTCRPEHVIKRLNLFPNSHAAAPPPPPRPEGAARLYTDGASVDVIDADIITGDTATRRETGFTFYSLFHGGVDASSLAWLPLHCECIGGCDKDPAARVLFSERHDLQSHPDFHTLRGRTMPVVDVLTGGAPCQPFSAAGLRLGLADKRGQLYVRQVELVASMPARRRPRAVVLEQVADVLTTADGRVQRHVLRRLRELGYLPQQFVLNSNDFGSASARHRLFTVAIRSDVHAAVGPMPAPVPYAGRRRAVRDVVIPLALRPSHHIHASQPWSSHPPHLDSGFKGPVLIATRPGPALGNHMYSLAAPAPTQRASGLHPTGVYLQDGSVVTLTPRESARCLDIDDAVDIGERWGDDVAQRFVGNSMSIFVMRAIGVELKRLLHQHDVSREPRPTADKAALDAGAQSAPEYRPLPTPPESAATDSRGLLSCDLLRHHDGCPIWCTTPNCSVCGRFSHRAGRVLVWYAWLRQERARWSKVRCAYADSGALTTIGEQRLHADFLRTLGCWRERLHDDNAPVRLVWWRWPAAQQEEIRTGVALGFIEPPEPHVRRNHPTGEHPHVLSEFARFEASGFVEKGSVSVTNPLAYVPKKLADIGRVLVDMRCSKVNSKLPAMPMVFYRIDDVGRSLYPNAWLFETDFRDHFYHFLVQSKDRRYLGVLLPRGAGRRRFTRLPMGCATSPYHCVRLTYAWDDDLHRYAPYNGEPELNLPGLPDYRPDLPFLYRRLADGSIAAEDFCYVDDALGIAPTFDAGVAALRRLVVHSGSFGFVLKYSKIKAPAQHGRSYNGFDIDTRPEHGGPLLRVRPQVRDETLALLGALQSRRSAHRTVGISRRQLAQIVGKLQSLAPAVPRGSTFLRRLYDAVHALDLPTALRPGLDYDTPVRLDDEHWKDVEWWLNMLTVHSGQRMFTNADVQTRAHFTDGSGRGTGGSTQVFNDKQLPRLEFFSGVWRPEAISMTSNWKELKSILIALRRERLAAARLGTRSPLHRCRVYHYTDNSTSEALLAKGTSTAPKLQQLLREVAYEELLQQCQVIPVHVAGKRLIAQGTDGLSRGQTAVGALSGRTTDVRHYNPLQGGLTRDKQAPVYVARSLPAALYCCSCRDQVSRDGALKCVNHSWSWHDFPACAGVFHPACYRVRRSRWTTVLPVTSHKGQGLCARISDARIRRFVCELCRFRAQVGREPELGERTLLEFERMRNLTMWNHQSDTTATGVATARLALQQLDAKLPPSCPPALLRRFGPYWPAPLSLVTLQWHMLQLSREGGKSEDGSRSLASLKKFRGAVFNECRELAVDDDAILKFDRRIIAAPGSFPTDSLGHELFTSGLSTRHGERAVQSWPMPPVVARLLESNLVRLYEMAQGAWPRYQLALAVFAHDLYFTFMFRGNEPFLVKLKELKEELYLDHDCPWCGHRHVGIPLTDRTKTNRTGRRFDVLSVPVTGVGLKMAEAALRVIECRAAVVVTSPYLFVSAAGKQWTSGWFMAHYVRPQMRSLSVAGTPSMAQCPWHTPRRLDVRVYRRGALTFYKKTSVDPHKLDLMGRWSVAKRNRMPSIMQSRYTELDCGDLVTITSAKPT